jgi:endonuclease/exonuclease/phosphatase family metal-dependent hydrolase
LCVRILITVLGCLWAAAILAVAGVQLFAPERDGPLALGAVVEPLLWISLLVFVPLALFGTARRQMGGTPIWTTALRVMLLVALVAAVVRLGPSWLGPIANGASASASGGGMQIGISSWNLEADDIDREALVDRVRAAPDGAVVLVELSKADAAAISGDKQIHQRFPNQLLYPDDGSIGVGLLSSRPVIASGHRASAPAIVWARLDLGLGRQVVVVGGHPVPATLDKLAGVPLPLDYDPAERDRELQTLRSTADGLVADDRSPLILAGDFNVTDQEPAYADLSDGLIDSQLATSYGPGWTWRPDPIKELPFGILRIDYVLSGNGAVPRSLAVDCTPSGSDHCLLHAAVWVP